MNSQFNNANTPAPTLTVRYGTSRSFSVFLDSVTLGVVGLLIIVVDLLYMTQIDANTEMSLVQFTLEGGILYAATVSIYLLLRSFARRKGTATEAWRNAFAAVERNNDWIVSQGIAGRIKEYCRKWEGEELAGSRERVLADAGISLADFNEKYMKYTPAEIKKVYPELSKFEFKTICRAMRVKRLRYNENYLSVYNRYGKRESPSQRLSTKTLERISTLRILVTTAITSVLGVSVSLQLVNDFSRATILMAVIKISIILISGVIGMVGGYNMMAVKAVEEMRKKEIDQNLFIKWCGYDLPPKEAEKETA